MYQKVIIVGNLGGDPTMRYTNDGTPVTSFSVAVNEVRGDRDSGEQQKRTIWWRVSVWRKQAETCNQYLFKGSKVLVEGTMQADAQTGGPRIWTGQDGQPRASYEITGHTVRFLSSRGEAQGADTGDHLPSNEDDIPF